MLRGRSAALVRADHGGAPMHLSKEERAVLDEALMSSRASARQSAISSSTTRTDFEAAIPRLGKRKGRVVWLTFPLLMMIPLERRNDCAPLASLHTERRRLRQ